MNGEGAAGDRGPFALRTPGLARSSPRHARPRTVPGRLSWRYGAADVGVVLAGQGGTDRRIGPAPTGRGERPPPRGGGHTPQKTRPFLRARAGTVRRRDWTGPPLTHGGP